MPITLKDLIDAAKGAGALIREGLKEPLTIDRKGTYDFVTDYDVKVEEYLKKRLMPLDESLTWVGEETQEDIGTLENALVVDPIDGTGNFMHRHPFVAVSIAHVIRGQVVSGVVYAPVLDELFYAERGKGAFLGDDKIHVNGDPDLREGLVAFGLPYDRSLKHKIFDHLVPLFDEVQGYRRCGAAAIDLCFVACGRYTGYVEYTLKAWDYAAGMLIVEEAGGRVTDWEGRHPGIRQETTIVASNGRTHDRLLPTGGSPE